MAATTPKTQAGLQISIPTDALLKKAREAEVTLEEHTRDILELMGFDLLQHVLEAYEEKSLGKTGSDGIQWAPIQVRTLLARMHRAGHIGNLKDSERKHVAKVKADPKAHGVSAKARDTGKAFRVNKAHELNDETFSKLKKAGVIVSLKYSKSKNAKIAFGAGHVFGIVKTGKPGKETVSETLKRTISPQSGGYQIGIDKGMQRQGLMPGKGGDEGPNMTFAESAVTVGACMHYSAEFDKMRPIIPENIPDQWIEDIQKKVVEYGATIIRTAFEKEST